MTRQPYVFGLDESPFDPSVPPEVRRQRVREVMERHGVDVVTDAAGMVVDFMSETDVEGVLNDTRFAAVALPTLHLSGVVDGPLYELWTHLMFAKDADEHRRIRNVVTREFSQRRIDRLRPDLERIASELCDAVARAADSGPVDLWERFAVPYASRLTCLLVGLPEQDADDVARWAFDLARAFFPFMSPERAARAERSAVELTKYIDTQLEHRREFPADDILTVLVGEAAEAQLSPAERRALAANMVFAGLEATAKSISTGVYHLIAEGRLAALAADPTTAPTAVLEVLRFSPPAQNVARLAPADMVCQGVELNAGQVVTANIVAACRDPKRYQEPDVLDLQRAPGKQLAFGAGAHFCLGANLAKVGMAVAFETIAGRFPTMSLLDGDGHIEWDYEGFAGIVRLDVVIPPA